MFTLLDEQKARRFWEEEIRQEGRAEGEAKGRAKGRVEGRAEGREEGGMDMLAGLVKDKLISMTEASKRAGLTVAEFSKKTGLPIQN